MDPTSRTHAAPEAVYTVSRLNYEARALLEGSFPPLWVEGEVSNLARPGSGHLYFTLKDAQCQVRCAMFRSRNLLLGFVPDNGMQILALAQVSLYEGRGEFQLVVEHLEPAGEGRLRLAFEALKRRLAAEGLFDEAHKIPLPVFPRAIGVLSSQSGAAIRDILSVLQRRFPALPVVLYPVPVQGSGAAETIARTIALADRRRDCDVLILARGGGSLEDLWAFNEEVVARAIYACELPLVAGIGHEIDFTIADLVADRRAPTPSAAAELVSPDRREYLARIEALERRLVSLIRNYLWQARTELQAIERRLLHPGRRLRDLAQRLDELWLRLERTASRGVQLGFERLAALGARLQSRAPATLIALRAEQCEQLNRRLALAITKSLTGRETRLQTLSRALHAVSPLATLARGYAIVTTLPERRVLRDAAGVAPGQAVQAQLGRGRLLCRVEGVAEGEP
jgi:exodeoxyribonuclease VII large subunit